VGIQLILIQIITFGIIVAILHFVFGSQLKLALKRLQDLHQENLEKEEVLNKEIERARTLSQTEIARSKDEAKRLIDNARHNAERVAEEARTLAQVQAKKIIAEAKDHVKTLDAEAAAATEEKAVDIAQQLIAGTFTERGSEALHRELVSEFLDELERLDPERLRVPAENGIQLAVARPLDADQRQRLEALLAQKRGRAEPLLETEDPSLITGVVLNMGGLVVDGSLKNRMKKALTALRLRQAQA